MFPRHPASSSSRQTRGEQSRASSFAPPSSLVPRGGSSSGSRAACVILPDKRQEQQRCNLGLAAPEKEGRTGQRNERASDVRTSAPRRERATPEHAFLPKSLQPMNYHRKCGTRMRMNRMAAARRHSGRQLTAVVDGWYLTSAAEKARRVRFNTPRRHVRI